MAEGEKPDDSEKTEEPTQKKLDDARKRGQVPLSREMNTWLMLLGGTLILAAFMPKMIVDLTVLMRTFLEQAHALPGIPGGFKVVLGQTLFEILKIMAVPLLALMTIAFLGPFVQVGPIFSAETIKPKLSKISVFAGFGRLFSKKALMEFLKGLMKIAIVSAVATALIIPFYDSVDHFVGLPLEIFGGELHRLVIRMMGGVMLVLLIVAIIDVIFQRQQFYKDMRMTQQEVKDEYRQSEGDPHVKGRLRQLRQERARQRMMQQVPDADVVITNPTHYAVALKYNPDEQPAPVCIAKGVENVALRIREVAGEHGIEIVENPPLARTLHATVELDEMIPEEQYKAVAEIISFVFKKRGKL